MPPKRVLTIAKVDEIEAFILTTLGKRSFPTVMGVEWWEWKQLLAAARKGLTDAS